MSDERDNVDAPDGTTDQNSGDQGGRSVATGTATPQRPTGKRSRQRALVGADSVDTDTSDDVETDVSTTNGAGKGPKAKTKKDRSDEPSRNPFLFVVNYLKQVVAELRKVIWPNRKQMVTYTSVVLVFLAFMVALISGVDLGLARVISLVFG